MARASRLLRPTGPAAVDGKAAASIRAIHDCRYRHRSCDRAAAAGGLYVTSGKRPVRARQPYSIWRRSIPADTVHPGTPPGGTPVPGSASRAGPTAPLARTDSPCLPGRRRKKPRPCRGTGQPAPDGSIKAAPGRSARERSSADCALNNRRGQQANGPGMWRGITKAEVIVAPVPSSTASHASRVNARRGPVAVRQGDHVGVQATGEVVADDREDHHRRYGPADRYAGQITHISLDLRVTGNRDRDGYHPHEIGRDMPVR
jgi:hypothetical protein